MKTMLLALSLMVSAAVLSAEPTPKVEVEKKATFDVVLIKFDPAKKISVIKVVREVTALGLKDSKDLVEKAPQVIKAGLSREEANTLKEKLEKEGATVELK